MNKVIWSVSGMLAATGMLALAGCKQEGVHPVVQPITAVVFATGHVESQGEIRVLAVSDGTLRSVPLQEGQLVEPSQILSLQDADAAVVQEKATARDLELTRENASQTSSVIQGLHERIRAAQSRSTTDSLQWERTRRLRQSQSVSQQELENAQVALDRSRSDLRSQENELVTTRRNLDQALVASESQHNIAGVNGGYLALRSPGRFRVWRVWKKPGEFLRKGEPIATLGTDSMVAKLDIDEGNIDRVRAGQEIKIELNTAKGLAIAGTLTRILPYFDESCQCYHAEARLPKGEHLLTGTLLQANILTDHKDQALLVPRAALESNHSSLRVWREGKLATVSVKTGIVTGDWAEILEGLAASDELVIGKDHD